MGENRFKGYAIADIVIAVIFFGLTFFMIAKSPAPLIYWPIQLLIMLFLGLIALTAMLITGIGLLKQMQWAEKIAKIVCWSNVCWYGLLIVLNLGALFLKEDVAKLLGMPIQYLNNSRQITQIIIRAGLATFFYFHIEKLDSHQVGLEY